MSARSPIQYRILVLCLVLIVVPSVAVVAGNSGSGGGGGKWWDVDPEPELPSPDYDSILYSEVAPRLREIELNSNRVKVEVIGDERTLFPDNEALLEATRTLAAEGFTVLPYTNDDPVVCKRLEQAGAAA